MKNFNELRQKLEEKLGRSIRRIQEIDPDWENDLVDASLTQEEAYERIEYVQAHCDSRVLHAPSVCKYCDEFPGAQLVRARAGVNFTGENRPGFYPCPAEAVRKLDIIHAWRGNQPVGPGVPEPLQGHLRAIESPASKMMYGWIDD